MPNFVIAIVLAIIIVGALVLIWELWDDVGKK